MPLLKYICKDCGRVFEELVFGENVPACPECSGQNVKRHYRGKCYFGTCDGGSSGKGSGGGSCSGGSCGSCCGCSH